MRYRDLVNIPVDIKAVPADIITVSSHKIHGPKGVGAIYIKKGTKINPIVYGGGHENNMRSGSHNLPAIAGFSKACEISFEILKQGLKRRRN
jgi:cysteine desulfurase